MAAAILLVGLGSLGPAQLSAQSSSNTTSSLGTNTDFFRWFSGEWVFVDAFKQSRQWLTQCITGQQPDCTASNAFDTGEEALLDKDSDGWVRSLPRPQDAPIYWIVGTMMFQNIAGHYPAGQYVVLYDGQGTIVYSGDATKNNALSAAHRDVLDVTPSATGIIMQITATDPNHTGDYLRNIRVIMPGFEATYASQVFHPTFLSRIAKYRTLRFKDWLETAASTQSSWSTRTLVSNARWDTPGGAGIPIEILMALVNRNGSDVWVNMPHMADDDYITQFATLVKSTLAPSARVYVEYSNEVWNGSPGHTQSVWVQQQAVAKWTGPEDPFTKQMNWHGMRTAQMCDIWKQVWGSQSNRVICVLGAQSGAAYTASQALDCPLWVEGKPCSAHHVDAVAIGPYFGAYLGNATYAPQVLTWTSDPDGGVGRVFQEITQGGMLSGGPTGGALQRARDEVSSHVAVATARGLYLVAYEGGTHIQDVENPQHPELIALFNTVNHDPRMGPVYDRYLADWKAAAGTTNITRLFIHFKNVAVPNNIGSLGALNYVDETSSPRFDALMRFIDSNPCWWPNCAATGGPLPTDTPIPTSTTVPSSTPTPPPTAARTATPTFTATATATSTPTATATPTLPPTPGLSCSPRPVIGVNPVPNGDGRLRVSVVSNGAGNSLLGITFGSDPGAVGNALVDAPAPAQPVLTAAPPPSAITLPAGTVTYTFFVRRATAGQATAVGLTIQDACGTWPTFVGGGPGSF
jgi:hypothetical protein